MVKLERIIDGDFPVNFSEGKRVEWELELLKNEVRKKKGRLEEHEFKPARWKEAKEQLIKETNGRCAYCEVRFNAVAYGDVEHYRPKSVYWWLAYSYHNYLPSCQLCNQKFKKAKFPIKNTTIPPPKVFKSYTTARLRTIAGNLAPNPKEPTLGLTYDTFLQEYLDERPYCINPYYEDPSIYFAYEFDDALREVTVIPAKSGIKKYISESEKVYGINRKELREMRYKTFTEYRILRTLLNGNNPLDALVKEMIEQAFDILLEGGGGFVGMIKYYETLNLDELKMGS